MKGIMKMVGSVFASGLGAMLGYAGTQGIRNNLDPSIDDLKSILDKIKDRAK